MTVVVGNGLWRHKGRGRHLVLLSYSKMEVEIRPIRVQDEVDNNENRTNCNETEEFQGLQLDFESEFSDFLNRDLPNDNSAARSGSTSLPNQDTNRIEYNSDGTVNCCDINYGTLVSIVLAL